MCIRDSIKAVGGGETDEVTIVTINKGSANIRVAPLIDFKVFPFHTFLGDIITVKVDFFLIRIKDRLSILKNNKCVVI